MKIGLLGGSFNPAHSGHIYISNEALKRLELDEIWWLVSPQNPLKSNSITAPLKIRLDNAKKIVENSDEINNIIYNDINEANLKELKKLYKQGIKLGVPEYNSDSVYGIEMNSYQTSVGKAKEIIDSFDEMVSISKNTNNLDE